jgi:hypothetical protein
MVANSFQRRIEALDIGPLLRTFPGLRLLPVADDRLRVAGTLAFSARIGDLAEIRDSIEIDISVPEGFPDELPLVRETGGRVPRSFHTNPDGSLCLGSPTGQRLHLVERPTLLAFLQSCVIPCFYGFLYFQEHGRLPLGELAHGWKGICQDYAELFGVKPATAAVDTVRLASLKKRIANKYPCPCGSGRRLGKCHNRKVNLYRTKLGRRWFRKEYRLLAGR